jgi:hypothetical protein
VHVSGREGAPKKKEDIHTHASCSLGLCYGEGERGGGGEGGGGGGFNHGDGADDNDDGCRCCFFAWECLVGGAVVDVALVF